mgnify:CR=1 FL=1
MKRIFTIIAAGLITASAFAQTPEKMSYQAVVRDGSNALVASSSVGMQISILQGSPSGSAVYVETQTPTSNANGLVSIEIGGGTVVSGDFSTIDWANGPYYIQMETDPTGGTSYTITGTSQLLSVPYALHAKNSDSWTTTGDSTYTYKKVGIGIVPIDEFHVYDPIQDGVATFESGDPGANIFLMDPSTTGDWFSATKIGTIDKNFRVYTNGSEQFVVDSLGSLGVGTNNPYAKLHIIDNATSADVLMEAEGDFNPLIAFKRTNSISYTDATWYWGLSGNGDIRLRDDLAGINRITVNQDGKTTIEDVMNLKPRSSAPTSPSKGDMYFDNNTNKLMVYDGTTWQACW